MSDIEEYEAKIHVAGVCEVRNIVLLTPRMKRITFHGEALRGLERHWRPEMLVRLYFPPSGNGEPPEPYLDGDDVLRFRAPEGVEISPFSAVSEDPLVRAYTGRAYRPETLELDIDFVLHETPGLSSDWARAAKTGDRLGMVEFQLPAGHLPASVRAADTYILLADEAALPAAMTNLEAFNPGAKVIAFFEVADASDELPVVTKADLTLHWIHRGAGKPGTNTLLLDALKSLPWPHGKVFVWACGEIRTATTIRKFVKSERALKKGESKTQAYWRLGATEVERMVRMTELSMAAAMTDPASFQESFEEIGMNIEDPSVLEREVSR